MTNPMGPSVPRSVNADPSALTQLLKKRIQRQGPLTIGEFMSEALAHPRYGYYATRDPFGVDGDFITAPEVSQTFGELIGLWSAVVWQGMGEPGILRLLELGPGRGTLMKDFMRAASRIPGFTNAIRLHFVETSPVLRQCQQRTIKASNTPHHPVWHEKIEDVPPGPMIIIANEFFDALPIRQLEQTGHGWCERLVGLTPDGKGFKTVLAPHAAETHLPPPSCLDATPGAVFEYCPLAADIAQHMGGRISSEGGTALIIDYGHTESALGETLQAVKRHVYHDVYDDPGNADITAHVDFSALIDAASEPGVTHWGPLEQGTFLENLGLAARFSKLLANAAPEEKEDLTAAKRRLTHRDEMGKLFKVLALTSQSLPPPPGFE